MFEVLGKLPYCADPEATAPDQSSLNSLLEGKKLTGPNQIFRINLTFFFYHNKDMTLMIYCYIANVLTHFKTY